MIFIFQGRLKFQNNIMLFILVIFTLIVVGCCKFPDLGDGYRLDYNSTGDICILDSNDKYIIYGHIIDYVYNNEYIIVSEKPRSIIPECNGTIKNATIKMCDDAFKKSKFYQVYIILKNKKLVFGPYNKKQYLMKKKEFGISNQLKLISIKE